jgi:hypothetical protein
MKILSSLLLAFFLWQQAATYSQAAEKARGEPVKGVVLKGVAFACGVEDDGFGVLRASFRWAPLAGGKAVKGPACAVQGGPPRRWHLAHGCLFVSYLLVSPLYGNFDDALLRYQVSGMLKGKLTAFRDDDEEGYTGILADGPVVDVRGIARVRNVEAQVQFDYLPTGPETVRLLLLTDVPFERAPATSPEFGGRLIAAKDTDPRWTLTTYDFKANWNAKAKTWQAGKWSAREGVEVAFQEPFQVAAVGEDYYFVTASGKVYRSPRPDKGKDRKAEAVWDDAKRPVVALIQDADAGKSFVFCKAGKDGKGVYFELAAKPELAPYDAAGIKPAKVDDPLPAVLGYAQALVADKKVKDK